MFDLSDGIDSLTNFKRQSSQYLDKLLESGEPLVLTVNGKAKVVVQDAAAYQKLVETAERNERSETIAAIKEGLADSRSGRSKPARLALNKLAQKYGMEQE
ncbi:Phd_YefM [Polystyrenella longa]|uniref:Antitoxin n=1 Tax=Polystyrenella longa TaxID=2528007 RepID=A0A518CK05_9PLAN|nr:type II toxin-antitoxin system Phd/YefM family antitoxin [Polystyrenella longa]QDU79563.1 Phd_YefM [Polystyrenella longa]